MTCLGISSRWEMCSYHNFKHWRCGYNHLKFDFDFCRMFGILWLWRCCSKPQVCDHLFFGDYYLLILEHRHLYLQTLEVETYVHENFQNWQCEVISVIVQSSACYSTLVMAYEIWVKCGNTVLCGILYSAPI